MAAIFFFTFDATIGRGAVRTASQVIAYDAPTVTEAWAAACRDGFYLVPGSDLVATAGDRWTARVHLA
jgi:hypothetical protein